jgi:hypothetical protein
VSINWPSGHSENLSDQERSTRASIAANHSWANTEDRAARTQPARDGLRAKWAKQVDPEGKLPPDELNRRVEHLEKAHMQRMSLAASKARRRKAEVVAEVMEGLHRESVAIREKALTDTLKDLVATTTLGPEVREKIAQILGDDA